MFNFLGGEVSGLKPSTLHFVRQVLMLLSYILCLFRFFPFFSFQDRVLLCTTGQSCTHYVALAGLELSVILLPQVS